MTLGVPRLEELIKASKHVKTPTLSLYLQYDPRRLFGEARDLERAKLLKESLERRARRLASTFKQVRIGDLTRNVQVLYTPMQQWPEDTREGATLRRWRTLVAPHVRQARADEYGPLLDWVLRIDLSRSRLLERRLSVASVGQALLRHYDGAVEVIYSDENDVTVRDGNKHDNNNNDNEDDGGFLFVRMHAYAMFDALRAVLPTHHRTLLRQIEIALEQAEYRAAATAGEERDRIVGHEAIELRAKKRQRRDAASKKSANKTAEDTETAEADEEDEPRREPSKADNAKEKPSATADSSNASADATWGNLDVRACFPLIMQELAADCSSIVLCGVEGVTGVLAREVPRTVYDSETGARIESAREWLLETDGNNLLGSFAVHGIDHRRTRCNNPVQVAQVLGIEAARRSLFEELRAVLQFDGAYVNCRHIALLCDIMTNAGALMAVSRHGLNRRQTGPLMRATLEESVSMLANAGCFSEFDPVSGPSERVATGRGFAHGTGSHIGLLLDTDALQNAKKPHIVSLADSFRKKDDALGNWSVETSPFAPIADANRLTMLRDMRAYVRRERERVERERQEHESVVRDLQKQPQHYPQPGAQSSSVTNEDFSLGTADAPFARPNAGRTKPTQIDMPGAFVNPFAKKRQADDATEQEQSDSHQHQQKETRAPAASFTNPFSQTTVRAETDCAMLADRQTVRLSDAIDGDARIKFCNPFARTASAPQEKSKISANMAATTRRPQKNVHFYVPSLPRFRNL